MQRETLTTMHPRIRAIATHLLTATISVCIVLATLEAATRGLVPWKNDILHRCDPLLGATGIANVDGMYYGMNPSNMSVPGVRVHMNSKGLRDREYDYARSAGTRVLILGDSIMEALQVPLEHTAQEILELELSRTQSTEVIAGAHSGWGTDNEFLYYREEGARYSPDLVLLAIYPWNDVRNNSRTLEVAVYGSSTKPYFEFDDHGTLQLRNFPSPCLTRGVGNTSEGGGAETRVVASRAGSPLKRLKEWLTDHSRLYEFSQDRIRRIPKLMSALESLGMTTPVEGSGTTRDRFEIYEGVFIDPAPRRLTEAWDITEQLIVMLEQEAVKNGSQFAVAIVPSVFEVDDQKWEALVNNARSLGIEHVDRTSPSRKLATFCSQRNIPSVALIDAMAMDAKKTRQVFYFEGDGHLTEAGNRSMAAALSEWLERSRLLRRRAH